MKIKANQQVVVILTREDAGGTAVWHMDIAGQGNGGPNAYPPAKVAHGSSADFHYIITGPGTNGVTFANTNPISVSKDNGTGLSPTVKGINSDQIDNVTGAGSRVLKFTDINSDPAVNLVYQLDFIGAQPLDPIIQNGGGGGNVYDPTGLWAAAGLAGLLLAAVFFFIGRAFQKRQR